MRLTFFGFVSKTTEWVAMKFGTDVHGAQRMYPYAFNDPLTFHLAPPADWSFHIFSEISHTST